MGTILGLISDENDPWTNAAKLILLSLSAPEQELFFQVGMNAVMMRNFEHGHMMARPWMWPACGMPSNMAALTCSKLWQNVGR